MRDYAPGLTPCICSTAFHQAGCWQVYWDKWISALDRHITDQIKSAMESA